MGDLRIFCRCQKYNFYFRTTYISVSRKPVGLNYILFAWRVYLAKSNRFGWLFDIQIFCVARETDYIWLRQMGQPPNFYNWKCRAHEPCSHRKNCNPLMDFEKVMHCVMHCIMRISDFSYSPDWQIEPFSDVKNVTRFVSLSSICRGS